MTPEAAAGLRDYLVQALESEVTANKKVMLAVPADKPEFTLDAHATPALKLVWHMASSELWFLQGVIDAGYTGFAGPMPETITTPAGVVEWYEATRPALIEAVKALPGEHLTKVVDFFGMVQMPNIMYLGWADKHNIHHRGQLSAYLRPMGGKVPGIYGGSYDEPMGGGGEAAHA